MPIRFRTLALALVLALPATARAQTPDAETLLRRMVRRASENVGAARAYTVAYTAGPTRTLAYLERTPKGEWTSRLEPGGETPLRSMLGGALSFAEIAHSDTLDMPMTGITEVRADTAAGRTVYAIDIHPEAVAGEDMPESVTALVDAETHDLVRVVTLGRPVTGKGASGAPMVVWVDMLEYRPQSGVRLPGRYHIRGWNIVPAIDPEQRASMLRQIQEGRSAVASSGSPADLWMYDAGMRMIETGVMELSIGLEVVAVNQPPPPGMKRAAGDDLR
jgi:hypothetical protein